MPTTVKITSKVLRIMGPDATSYPDIELAERGIEQQVSEIDWGQAEDAINDQLPDGWYCKLEDY